MNEDNKAWDYRTMSAEDRRTFHRWLNLNAAAGLILASGLVAMAWVGSNSAGPRGAMLANNVADPVASEKAVARTPNGTSVQSKDRQNVRHE